MPSFDDRPYSAPGALPMPGLNQLTPSTGPLSTGETSTALLPPTTGDWPSVPQLEFPRVPGTTNELARIILNPSGTTSQRLPVVIKGQTRRKYAPLSLKSQRRRRAVVSLFGVLVLLLISGLALLWSTPLGHDIGLNFSPFQAGGSSLMNNQSGVQSLIAQATATAAVIHYRNDGLDPYSHGTVTTTNGSGSLIWPTGECTYWANYRYHALTNHWVAWRGNAWQWKTGAQMAGWNVSQTPPANIPSIIVLMPGVQGAGSYGHVAVVEKILSSTSVSTSNMNWGYGYFDRESTVTFSTGSGTWFIWHS